MSYTEIIHDIKKNELSPLYVFYGNEKYLIEYGLKTLKNKFVDSVYADFNYITLDGNESSVQSIIDSLETVPLFSEKKVVVINNAPYFKKTKVGITALEEEKLINYFENPSNQSIGIFITKNDFDKRRKIYKKFKQNGKFIEFGKFSNIEFFKWISKKFAKAKKKADKAVIMHIIENIGYLGKNSTSNLFDVDLEISKLISYVSEKEEIQIADVDNIIEKSFESNIFELLDEIGNKNIKRAVKITHRLLDSGEAELKIIAMISRQFRLIYKVKSYEEEGYSISTISTKIGVPLFVARKNSSIARGISYSRIAEIIGECIKYERFIKTGKMIPTIALEVLIASISNI